MFLPFEIKNDIKNGSSQQLSFRRGFMPSDENPVSR
jgi:hypothetical protein